MKRENDPLQMIGIVDYGKSGRLGKPDAKTTLLKLLEIVVESANYIVISCALSGMALLFGKPNILSALFMASECWLMMTYWEKARSVTGSKLVAAIMLVACFAIHIGITYSIGVHLGTFNG